MQGLACMGVVANLTINISTTANFDFSALPKAAVHQNKVARYVDQLSTANMEVALNEFTTFHTRYYKSDTGLDSAKWLYKQISDLIEETSGESDISIRKFEHPWKQFSIIGKTRERKKNTTNFDFGFFAPVFLTRSAYSSRLD